MVMDTGTIAKKQGFPVKALAETRASGNLIDCPSGTSCDQESFLATSEVVVSLLILPESVKTALNKLHRRPISPVGLQGFSMTESLT
jgi:hypothetical protein